MKKMYITPAVEINKTTTCNMMAISLQTSPADDSEVLSKEDCSWDLWNEAVEE